MSYGYVLLRICTYVTRRMCVWTLNITRSWKSCCILLMNCRWSIFSSSCQTRSDRLIGSARIGVDWRTFPTGRTAIGCGSNSTLKLGGNCPGFWSWKYCENIFFKRQYSQRWFLWKEILITCYGLGDNLFTCLHGPGPDAGWGIWWEGAGERCGAMKAGSGSGGGISTTFFLRFSATVKDPRYLYPRIQKSEKKGTISWQI